ncbi:MAG: GntR family transcriptional regulator [Peptococcaceae bacterium]|nr:GntR family transcriptional regulator [Peptococcaceae bacterium]
MRKYTINPDSRLPAYQQLVQLIHGDIKSGNLPAGTQLPTVRQLADGMGLARGTIKHAYDELEALGALEMTRGRGTFVRELRESQQSRKDRAMKAIDGLLDQLADLEFTLAEVGIFFELKLRERSQEETEIKIAMVENEPEILRQAADQLKSLEGVRIFPCSLREALVNPYKLGEEMDLILTTPACFAALEEVIPEKEKLMRVALALEEACAGELAALALEEAHAGRAALAGPAGADPAGSLGEGLAGADRDTAAEARRGGVGILSASPQFEARLRNSCRSYAPGLKLSPSCLLEDRESLAGWLEGKEAVLLPRDYDVFCRRDTLELLNTRARRRVLCAYRADEGSLLYLQERIGELKAKNSYTAANKPLLARGAEF